MSDSIKTIFILCSLHATSFQRVDMSQVPNKVNPSDPVKSNNQGLDGAASGQPTFQAVSLRCLFEDQKRQVDMILVYHANEDSRAKAKREYFENALIKHNLQLEYDTKVTRRYSFWGTLMQTTFVKVHIPLETFTHFAELMNIIKVVKKPPPKEERNPENKLVYLQRFEKHNIYTSSQRSYVVWNIMLRTKYGDSDEQYGIQRLLSENVYSDAYPLHDGKYKGGHAEQNTRKELFENWAQISCWRKEQPLWEIKLYFGDKIALYFAWLSFYTKMLIVPSIVGLLCFLYGVISIIFRAPGTIPSREICEEGSNITICPLCDKVCDFIELENSCVNAKMSHLFDNPATVFFAIFMAFWATVFLELWKRYQAVLQWKWSLMQDQDEEPPRPSYEEFIDKLHQKRRNPVTHQEEAYVPVWSRVWRKMAAASIVLFMLMVVVAVIVGTIVYKLSLLTAIHSSGDDYMLTHAKLVTSLSAALMNLITIMILGQVYYRISHWLTHLENPRTQSEYEDSFTFKMFVFEFVNFYSSLIYIAFVKGSFYTYPGDPDLRGEFIFSIKRDVCDPSGCLPELFIQLAVIMVGKQAASHVFEYCGPRLRNCWKKWKYGATVEQEDELTQWQEDRCLEDYGNMGLFEEYLEMVIQYGFVTLFVAAFPLAPIFALLNNILEIRIDAHKLVAHMRRPVGGRVLNIGAWYSILEGITYLAVAFNAFVIAYTSDFIQRVSYQHVISPTGTLHGYIRHTLSKFNTSHYECGQVHDTPDDPMPKICYYRAYREDPDVNENDRYKLTSYYWYMNGIRLAFVVIFEHIVFALTGIVAYAIPDVPAYIKREMHKEKAIITGKKYNINLLKKTAHLGLQSGEKT